MNYKIVPRQIGLHWSTKKIYATGGKELKRFIEIENWFKQQQQSKVNIYQFKLEQVIGKQADKRFINNLCLICELIWELVFVSSKT